MTAFENYTPADALFSLEQRADSSVGALIRAQAKGRGQDLVYMFVKALEADEQEGGNLKTLLVDALTIFETGEKLGNLTILKGTSKSDVVN